MKAWVQAVIATGIFLRFLQMTLPKGTTETQSTSKAAHLGGRGGLKGSGQCQISGGWGPLEEFGLQDGRSQESESSEAKQKMP